MTCSVSEDSVGEKRHARVEYSKEERVVRILIVN
jgi:hypothetical protein